MGATELFIKEKTLTVNAQIVSKNNWLTRAGAFLDEKDHLHLPMKHIVVSMTNASHCIEQYQESLPHDEKLRLVQTLALNVRSADTAYFKQWSKTLVSSNDQNWKRLFECFNCFTKTLSPESLRARVLPPLNEAREHVNVKIIHSLENAITVKAEDFESAFTYYDLFFQLNLMSYPAIYNLQKLKCKECVKKP